MTYRTLHRTSSPPSTKQTTSRTTPQRRSPGHVALRLFRRTKTRTNTWTDVHFPVLLRLSLGLIYLWFGALKFVPNLSPAEQLVRATINEVSELTPAVSLPPGPVIWFLALWETAIGLGLIIGRKQQIFLVLLAFQIMGTALPLVLLPHVVWSSFPLGLTIEGQFIVKNLVIVTGAIAYSRTISKETID